MLQITKTDITDAKAVELMCQDLHPLLCDARVEFAQRSDIIEPCRNQDVAESLGHAIDEQVDFWIAKYQDRTVGCNLGILLEESGNYSNAGIYVIPDFRGKSVVQRLLREQLDYAQSIGTHGIETYVNSVNLRVMKFLQKRGFKISSIDILGEFQGWRAELAFA